MSSYPAINDREFDLLKKIAANTAVIADDEAGDVSSVNGRTGAVVLTKSDVALDNVTNNAQALAGLATASLITTPTATIIGRSTAGTGALESLTAAQTKTLLSLNNVDNTSDANKPVSTAAQTALDGKAATGLVAASGLTMNTARILGRTTASAGAIEELTVGTSLSLSAGSLNAIQDIRTAATPTFVGLILNTANGTTSASGVLLGTDVAFFRGSGGEAVLNHIAGTGPTLTFRETATNTARIFTSGGDLSIGTMVAGKTLVFKTAASVTALTLSATQNATFAGTITTAAPTVGAAAAWNLGVYSADLVTTQTGVLNVNVGGVSYKVLCST